MIVGNWS